VEGGFPRPQLERPADQSARLVPAGLRVGDQAQQVQGVGVIRLPRQDRAVQPFSLLEAAGPVMTESFFELREVQGGLLPTRAANPVRRAPSARSLPLLSQIGMADCGS
jgi:hypothetical protein